MRRPTLIVLAVALVCAGLVLIILSTTEGPRGSTPRPIPTFAVVDPVPDPTRTAVVPAIPADPPSPSAAATPTPAETTMDPERMEPSRLYVPSIGVYTSLEPVQFSGGSLTIPEQPWVVGIDKDSAPVVAPVGTTLLAGHVDISGTPGALARLAQAQPGAMVYVTDAQGQRSAFVTTSLQQYSKVALPRSIFEVTGTRQLAVVTCGGPVVEIEGERHYRDNVVLTAVPAA